ncbi:aquaporin [Candidatus Saccharibacteria bacterium]|nr:aquaporin [Candidatus Saccharibacteria bacterium]
MAKSKSKKSAANKSKKDEEVVTTKTEEVKKEEVKTEAPEREEKEAKVEAKAEKTEAKTEKCAEKKSFKELMSGFFKKKYDTSETILTIFSRPQTYGALLGEIIGTMLLTMTVICLGMTNPLYIWFAMMAITVAVFGLSGANLNPLITVGMMASRRMSAIRGVLYVLAQIIGAWLGMTLTSGFKAWGESAAEMPAMAEVADGNFWKVAIVELVGAIILAFFFARAWAYRKSPLTFGMIVGTGLAVTIIYVYIISQSYFSLSNNFMMNPAMALMYQILPSAGDNFGEIMGGIMQALTIYVLFPMVGGVLGFYLSDFTSRLSGEREKFIVRYFCDSHCCCDGSEHHCDKK